MPKRPRCEIHFVLILVFVLFGCSAPQRPQPPKQDLLTDMYIQSSSDLMTLRIVYNACKEHLATNGQGKARVCQKIASIPGDNKPRILALVILNDFKVADGETAWTPTTQDGSLYLTFMKMQAERYLKGEISWYEMDYSIMSKGAEISKSIPPPR